MGRAKVGLLAQLRLMFDPPPELSAAPIPQLVRHARARQYVLRVLSDGTPRVTIPRWGSKREALAFLHAQQDWVARQRLKQAERAQHRPSRVWPDGHTLLLSGHRVLLRQGGGGRAGVIEEPDRLVVTPRGADGGDLRPMVSAWLLTRARRLLPPRLIELAARFELDVTQVSIRNQRARWGSCASGGRISLNWRLIQTPDDVRDYVLIHELMHLRQPNHSARFWALVARACPGHEASRRWLRAHEAALLDA
jgi:predicted metal-dependent hydrolase